MRRITPAQLTKDRVTHLHVDLNLRIIGQRPHQCYYPAKHRPSQQEIQGHNSAFISLLVRHDRWQEIEGQNADQY